MLRLSCHIEKFQVFLIRASVWKELRHESSLYNPRSGVCSWNFNGYAFPCLYLWLLIDRCALIIEGVCMGVVYWHKTEIKCSTAIILWKRAKSNNKLKEGNRNHRKKNPLYCGAWNQEKQIFDPWWFSSEVLPMAAGKIKRFGL